MDDLRMARILIGTSGWHYASWRGPFFPADVRIKDQLSYYADQFDTTELNGVFYRTPTPEAVTAWREQTGPDFVFAWKASKFITHWKRLSDRSDNSLELLEDRISLLRGKAGPILFQLPPQWPVDQQRLESFFEVLPRRRRYAFEFRNPTWNTAPVYDLLAKHNAALCIFDLAGVQSPIEVTAEFTYIRLHGPGGKYQGSYDERTLRAWAKRIQHWGLKAAYVYFDNDQVGYAPKNAARLREILDGA